MSVTVAPWGTAPTGEEVLRIELRTDRLTLGVLTWGATVQSLVVPDADGAEADVVLGFDALAPYLGDHPFLGATVGRFANRIAGAAFELDGRRHDLVANDGTSTLHGGPEHFGRRPWQLLGYDDRSVSMGLVSADGDMGFPGRLEVTTVFRVDGGSVEQATTATTDAPTVVNLTNHAYFNLHGSPDRPIDDHVLQVPAGCYLPVDDAGIPLPAPPTTVAGTPLDYREPRAIGEADHDHTLVTEGPVVLTAAGRRLTLTTTEPGVQLYTGQHLEAGWATPLTGRAGVPLRRRGGLCLETQHFPDSPHRPDYPSTVLRPGATYRTATRWAFTGV